MSTTTPTSTDPRASRARRLFDDLLFQNPEVCSHCFARIRDREEHGEPADRLGTGNRPTETLERAGAGELGQDVEDHDTYGVRRSYHARTFCGECGRPGGRADDAHIASLQELRGRVDSIVRRLHEAGYFPSLRTLYGTVATLKQNPEHQGADTEILATAVFLAIDSDDS